MTVVYVKEQGAVIRKRGGRLVVEKDDQILTEILTRHTTSVSLFGSVQVTTQAMSEMLERGIGLTLFTRHGRLKGHLVPEESKNVEIRVRQFRAAFDEGRCLELAREVVRTKLLNSADLLEDYRSNYDLPGSTEAAGRLKEMAGECAALGGRDELMGKEGAGAAAYFEAFALMNRSEIPFTGRRKHPATDPVNALLSLGYTMAMNELRGVVEAAGMDPHVGFLHVADYGRPSLALDLVEAFRAPLVDRLTLRLLNERILTGVDFATRVGGPRDGSVVLMPEVFPKYIEHYEAAMREPRKAALGGLRLAFGEEVGKRAGVAADGCIGGVVPGGVEMLFVVSYDVSGRRPAEAAGRAAEGLRAAGAIQRIRVRVDGGRGGGVGWAGAGGSG